MLATVAWETASPTFNPRQLASRPACRLFRDDDDRCGRPDTKGNLLESVQMLRGPMALGSICVGIQFLEDEATFTFTLAPQFIAQSARLRSRRSDATLGRLREGTRMMWRRGGAAPYGPAAFGLQTAGSGVSSHSRIGPRTAKVGRVPP